MRRILAAAVVALAAACGGSEQSAPAEPAALADRDPSGAEACRTLAAAIGDVSNNGEAVAAIREAGAAAALSETPEIAAATVEVEGKTFAHGVRLRAACVAEGFDMPEFPTE